jgi:hypothetical protein
MFINKYGNINKDLRRRLMKKFVIALSLVLIVSMLCAIPAFGVNVSDYDIGQTVHYVGAVTDKAPNVTDAVISEGEYKYGDVPSAPQRPMIADDGEYKYNFIGWDSEIVSVSSDATYTAVFEKIPIPKDDVSKEDIVEEEEEKELQITPSVMKIILMGLYALIATPCVIFAIVRVALYLSRRRREIPKKRR